MHTNHDALAQILADSAVEVSEAVTAKLGRSLHVRHLDAGSCNACDFELGAMSNPVYDYIVTVSPSLLLRVMRIC